MYYDTAQLKLSSTLQQKICETYIETRMDFDKAKRLKAKATDNYMKAMTRSFEAKEMTHYWIYWKQLQVT